VNIFQDTPLEHLRHVVWNYDEVGFCHAPCDKMVIAERGVRNLYQTIHGNSREYTNVHCCVNGIKASQ
jgi:hypothetical protein